MYTDAYVRCTFINCNAIMEFYFNLTIMEKAIEN